MRLLKLEKRKNGILVWFEDDTGKIRSLEFRSKKQIESFLSLISANVEDIEEVRKEFQKLIVHT